MYDQLPHGRSRAKRSPLTCDTPCNLKALHSQSYIEGFWTVSCERLPNNTPVTVRHYMVLHRGFRTRHPQKQHVGLNMYEQMFYKCVPFTKMKTDPHINYTFLFEGPCENVASSMVVTNASCKTAHCVARIDTLLQMPQILPPYGQLLLKSFCSLFLSLKLEHWVGCA